MAVAELQREVEDLRLRLQMAAEHYKDKYKECQKFQKQAVKLSEQQGGSKPSGYIAIPPSESSVLRFYLFASLRQPLCFVSGEEKSRV